METTGNNNQKNSYDSRFATEPMWPLIMKMALPAVAAQLVNLLYSIIDRVYIGHIAEIGTDALAGVGICNTLIIIIGAFAQFVGAGGAPLAGIELGKGNLERARKILNNGFLLLIGFTVILLIVINIWMEPLLRLTGASDSTIVYALPYMRIYLMGTIFVEITLGLNTFINTQGKPGISMCIIVLGAVLNIILDPVFIFVFGMGVRGAATATVISQACSAVCIIIFLTRKTTVLAIRKKYMKPDLSVIKQICSLGISPFIMACTESVIGFILNGSLAAYGDIYVSALTIMQSAMQIIAVPLAGFTQGSVPVISYNYGHKDPARVKESVKVITIVAFAYNLILCLFFILAPGIIASLFTQDAELIATVKEAMPWFMTGMTIFGLQRAFQNTFIATNQAKVSLFIALLRKIILLVPLALILPHFITPGQNGVFLAESIADALACICCTIIFLCKFPRMMKKLTAADNT